MMETARPVVIVTGGARGIGRATCEAFAQKGYRVAVADFDLDEARVAASALAGTGADALAVHLDVTVSDSVNGMFQAVGNEFGQVDVLVNNAGLAIQGPSAEFADDDWDRLLAVHLTGTFKCSRAGYEWLRKSDTGSIVNLSSIAATRGLPGRLTYCAAKAGIDALTRALAVEWAADGIRVNAVAPGWTRTPLFEDSARRGVVSEERLASAIPMARLARPEEIAAVIVFLASPQASYVTGQTLLADGGVTVGINV